MGKTPIPKTPDMYLSDIEACETRGDALRVLQAAMEEHALRVATEIYRKTCEGIGYPLVEKSKYRLNIRYQPTKAAPQ